MREDGVEREEEREGGGGESERRDRDWGRLSRVWRLVPDVTGDGFIAFWSYLITLH